MHDCVVGLLQKCSPVHERIFERFSEGVECTVLAFRFPITEQGTRIAIAQDAADIIKTDMQQPRSLEDASHRSNALRNREIRRRKRFMYCHSWESDFCHPIVFEADDGVANRA